jgi:hypothetical protein
VNNTVYINLHTRVYVYSMVKRCPIAATSNIDYNMWVGAKTTTLDESLKSNWTWYKSGLPVTMSLWCSATNRAASPCNPPYPYDNGNSRALAEWSHGVLVLHNG